MLKVNNNNSQKALETIETAASLFDLSYVIEDLIKIKLFTEEYSDVIQEFEKKHYTSATKPTTLVLGYTAIAYFKTGQTDKADNLLNELEARSKKSPVGSPSFFIASVYTAMGKNDLAIQWLEKAFKDHEVEMYWLKVEPTFKPLHDDPRFQKIINKMGYPK